MKSAKLNSEILRRGIASYQAQQQYLLDWLDESGSATDLDFDRKFGKYGSAPKFEWLMAGDSFILGSMAHGFSEWSRMLDLLQIMAALEMVSIKESGDKVIYQAIRRNQS